MLKKFIKSLCITLCASNLTACGYLDNFLKNQGKAENLKPNEDNITQITPSLQQESNQLPQSFNDDATAYGSINHTNDLRSFVNERKTGIVATNNADRKSVACIDIEYTTVSDKVQTLGFLRKNTMPPAVITNNHDVQNQSHNVTRHKVIKNVRRVTRDESNITSSNNAPSKTEVHNHVSAAPVENVKKKSISKIDAKNQEIKQSHHEIETQRNNENFIHSEQKQEISQNNDAIKVQPNVITEAPKTDIAINQTISPVQNPGNAPTSESATTVTPLQDIAADKPNVASIDLKGSVSVLQYFNNSIDLNQEHIAVLEKIIADLKTNSIKSIKINSYSNSKDVIEARRSALQRAIKIRKYFIEKDIAASRISVQAVEDQSNIDNKVEIVVE